MKKLILHIGAHKTGTTAIQHNLNRQRRRLRERGWEFVTLANTLNLGRLVKWEISEKRTRFFLHQQSLKQLLKQMRSTPLNCVISAEDLFFINDETCIAEFSSALNAIFDDIQVVIYLRRQDEIALSQKAQGAKTMQSALIFGSTPEPLPVISRATEEYLNYNAKVCTWGRQFGDTKLTIRIYDRATLFGGDSTSDFIHTTGLPITAHRIDKNVSLGAQATLLLHLLRRSGINQETIWIAQRCGCILNPKGNLPLPSRSESQDFVSHFRASNDALAGRLGLARLFDDDFSSYPDQAEKPILDTKYAAMNVRRINTLLRSFATPENARTLREIGISTRARLPRKSKFAIQLASRIDAVQSSQMRASANNSLEEQIMELQSLHHFAKSRVVSELDKFGELLLGHDPKAAYELTSMACSLRPFRDDLRRTLATREIAIDKSPVDKLTFGVRRVRRHISRVTPLAERKLLHHFRLK